MSVSRRVRRQQSTVSVTFLFINTETFLFQLKIESFLLPFVYSFLLQILSQKKIKNVARAFIADQTKIMIQRNREQLRSSNVCHWTSQKNREICYVHCCCLYSFCSSLIRNILSFLFFKAAVVHFEELVIFIVRALYCDVLLFLSNDFFLLLFKRRFQ